MVFKWFLVVFLMVFLSVPSHVAVGQNLKYLFGVGYHPKVLVVFFGGFWDVQRGAGVLTHGHVFSHVSNGFQCFFQLFDDALMICCGLFIEDFLLIF